MNTTTKATMATITRATLNKLYHIGQLTKHMYLERNVRLSVFSNTFKYGTTLFDFDDTFKIPINNLQLFTSMIESAMGKDDSVEIEYSVIEKEIGLDVKKLYTVDIINKNQNFRFYSSESDEFLSITPADLGDKSKIHSVPENYIRFKLSPEIMKSMDKNSKILSADTIYFKIMEKSGNIKCKIYNSTLPDSAVSEFKLDNIESNNGEDFPLFVGMFNVIDKNMEYDVVINCAKNAILFANEASGTFYISAAKRIEDN